MDYAQLPTCDFCGEVMGLTFIESGLVTIKCRWCGFRYCAPVEEV